MKKVGLFAGIVMFCGFIVNFLPLADGVKELIHILTMCSYVGGYLILVFFQNAVTAETEKNKLTEEERKKGIVLGKLHNYSSRKEIYEMMLAEEVTADFGYYVNALKKSYLISLLKYNTPDLLVGVSDIYYEIAVLPSAYETIKKHMWSAFDKTVLEINSERLENEVAESLFEISDGTTISAKAFDMVLAVYKRQSGLEAAKKIIESSYEIFRRKWENSAVSADISSVNKKIGNLIKFYK